MTFQFLVPLPECERQMGKEGVVEKKQKNKTKKNRCNFNTSAMSRKRRRLVVSK